MMHPRIISTCLAALIACAGWAGPAQNAVAAELMGTSGAPIEVEVGGGGIIKLDQPPATVFIADPKVADVDIKSPRLLYILGKKQGTTTLIAVNSREEVVVNQRVVVRHNISRINDMINRISPGSKISARSVNDKLILYGDASTAADAENARQIALGVVKGDKDVINQIRVTQPNQVNLRVRVAEVSRNVLKQFGFNWDALLSTGNFLYGISTGAPVLATPFFGTDPGFEFFSRNDGTNSGMGFHRSANADVNVIIDALEDEGLVSILAEPNLTAISGENATFLAGGEFPIITNNSDGETTISFKKFGVSLAFTPVIISHNRISLKVNPEVSELSAVGQLTVNGLPIPGLSTRRAETTVELGSGQSFAIAGMISSNINETINKYPGLADIPILGTLFRSTTFQRKETELVIIVTPYVVRPVSPGKLADPTDGYIAPSDVDRIFQGQTYRASMQRQRRNVNSRGAQGLQGPAGFVLK